MRSNVPNHSAPRWLTGDLVAKEPMSMGKYRRRGVVVGVRRCNADDRLSAQVYPWVYYVFFQDGRYEGPLFQSELADA